MQHEAAELLQLPFESVVNGSMNTSIQEYGDGSALTIEVDHTFILEAGDQRRLISTKSPRGPRCDGTLALLVATEAEFERLKRVDPWVATLAAEETLEHVPGAWVDCAVLVHFAGGGSAPSIHAFVHTHSIIMMDEKGRTADLDDGDGEPPMPTGCKLELRDRADTFSMRIGSADRFEPTPRAIVPSLQTLALRVVAAHVDAESSLEFSLPYGGSVELLESMKSQGRLRGDTLGPLLRASPDELSPVLGSRLTLAAAGCPALRDVCAQRLRCQHQSEQGRDQMPQGTRQRHTVDRHAGAR